MASGGLSLASAQAMYAVINVPELLETVLQFLDLRTLFTVPLVCRSWHTLFKQMVATNSLVRKRLFLLPATLEEVLEPAASPIHDDNVYLQRARRVRFDKPKLEPKVAILNPFFHKTVEGYSWSGDLLQEMMNANDMRKDMLLTQPPLEHITWPVTFGPKEVEGTGEHGRHREGSYLWIKTNGSNHTESPLRGVGELMKMIERKVRHYWGCTIYWKASGIRLEGEKITRAQLEDVLGGVELDEDCWRTLERYEYIAQARTEDVILSTRASSA